MIIEILLAILLGCVGGIITGLIPGIHVNLVAIIALSFSVYLLELIQPITVAVFIISVAVMHTWIDSIPSIFLGAPEAETALSVLPGHKLLLEGRGHEAVKLTVFGSLIALYLGILLSPLFIVSITPIYEYIKQYIGYMLIFICIYLIFKTRDKKSAFMIFILAGILGIAVFNLKTLPQALLPMLSGLFGTSQLFLSYFNKVTIPKQRFTRLKVPKKESARAIASCSIGSSLVSFMPGIGAAQAAIVSMQFAGKISREGFLIMIGGINTMVIFLSFIALYTIEKARNGAVVVISQIIKQMTFNYLLVFIATSLVVAGIATISALVLSRIFANLITKINYNKLCIAIIVFVTIMVFIFSSWLGLLVLLISSFLGMIPPLIGVPRFHLMGCLMLPVILFFIL